MSLVMLPFIVFAVIVGAGFDEHRKLTKQPAPQWQTTVHPGGSQ